MSRSRSGRPGFAASRGRSDRGAAAIEAALLLPLFLLLILGIAEWSLVMRDEVAVTSAVRTGVRTASIPPPKGAVNFTQATADSIQKAGSAMPKDNIEYIIVYQSNTQGYPLPEGNTAMSCTAAGDTCVKHSWNDVTNKFDNVAGEWDSALVNTCAGDPGAQAVGVYMKANHPTVTRLFRSSFSIENKAVLKFEPRPKAVCKN